MSRHAHGGMPVEERKRDLGFGEMLPDELQHQQLVEVGVQQRADHRIELPVVVMRAFGEIDDHRRRAGPNREYKGNKGWRLLTRMPACERW